MREHWTEDLVCPNCQKTGRAELSQTDDQSGDIEAESIPAGFKVIQIEHGIIFHCLLRYRCETLMTLGQLATLASRATAPIDLP